jgi:hypothetical protein
VLTLGEKHGNWDEISMSRTKNEETAQVNESPGLDKRLSPDSSASTEYPCVDSSYYFGCENQRLRKD